MLLFGLVVLASATAVLGMAAAAGRRPAPVAVTSAVAGLLLTLEGTRQPRESMLFGGLLVVVAFGALLVAGLGMAVGPDGATWIPDRRGAAACTVGAIVVMAVGFALVPAASR